MPKFLLDEFQDGDVLYGFNHAREKYQKQLEDKGYKYITADSYHTGSNDLPTTGVNLGGKQSEIKVHDAQQGKYVHALHHHPHYKPAEAFFCNEAAILSKEPNVSGMDSPNYWLAIRRACKFGIEHFVMKLGKTVHFLLDDLDMETVVNKKAHTKHSNGREITGSELRFIYRNRDALMPTGLVKFYRSGIQLAHAPWDEKETVGDGKTQSAIAWDGYTPKGSYKIGQ